MSEKIRLICEGDMDCTNQVFLTKKELIALNTKSKIVTCSDCEPKYGSETRSNPLSMIEFEDDIGMSSNPEEPR